MGPMGFLKCYKCGYINPDTNPVCNLCQELLKPKEKVAPIKKNNQPDVANTSPQPKIWSLLKAETSVKTYHLKVLLLLLIIWLGIEIHKVVNYENFSKLENLIAHQTDLDKISELD